MAGLDDLLAQIPVADIARRLGADEGEVNCAVEHLVPSLLAGLQNNARGDAAEAGRIETAACRHAASGLLDGGVAVDDVDESDGDRIVANIFGGNTSTSVASALSGTGAGSSDLIRKLLPILAPIVLAYIGKQFSPNPAAGTPQAAGGGGLGDLLGSILGGAGGQGGDNPLGSILGSVLGGRQSGQGGQGRNTGTVIGDILGGLLGGRRS